MTLFYVRMIVALGLVCRRKEITRLLRRWVMGKALKESLCQHLNCAGDKGDRLGRLG
jgi:hypothetical protein